MFTTDPQLASGKYTVLKDPKNIFGFQNIALVINTKKLQQLGGDQFMSIINSVNKLLTTPAVVAMNKAVAIDKQPAATVAQVVPAGQPPDLGITASGGAPCGAPPEPASSRMERSGTLDGASLTPDAVARGRPRR